MVEMKQLELQPDQYGGLDVRKLMEQFNVLTVKLTTTNKCYVREIAAGNSKATGKPYQAFKTYTIKAEHNGNEVFVRLPNAMVAKSIEELSVGDTFEITCLPHPKGKTFIVEKKE